MRSIGRGLMLSAILNPRAQGTTAVTLRACSVGRGGIGGLPGIGAGGACGVNGSTTARIKNGG